jgi:hypothetical protein
VLTWSRDSIGCVGEVFEVITQVDLGLIWLIRPLVLMMLIKNLWSYKFGRDKTYEMLADNFYWSKMR